MNPRPRRRLAAPVAGVATVAMVMAGCTPPASDGGVGGEGGEVDEVVVTPERVKEVRAAREALAEPVPAVTGEGRRLVEALEEVWTREAAATERAELAGALRLEPFRGAVEDLDAVELAGDGPDVAAAAGVVDALVVDARTLLGVADEELASLEAVTPFDRQLEGLLEGWDQRGSYSQQVAAFEELALEADALAEDAAGRSGTPACVALWPRREEAARVVAERTRELRALIRDRRGQEFDELRDAYGQDPYGNGELLGILDARAAASCWGEDSQAPVLLESLRERTDELAQALDPEDLRG